MHRREFFADSHTSGLRVCHQPISASAALPTPSEGERAGGHLCSWIPQSPRVAVLNFRLLERPGRLTRLGLPDL